MLIQRYFNQIKDAVARYSATRFVIATKLDYDLRAGAQGLITGIIRFVDGSVLHFKEYIDAVNQKVGKLSYSYHYQDADNRLIFRYDNAAHRPSLSFAEHKHLHDQIIAASAPKLEDVLSEIFVLNRWIQ